jgi:hypothetical protein
MRHDDEAGRRINAFLDAIDWAHEQASLKDWAETCLESHCQAAKPRLGDTAEVYVELVKRDLRERGAYFARRHPGLAILQLLLVVIEELIDDDDAKTQEIIESTPWERTSREVLFWAVRKYRSSEIAGKTMGEHLNDAVTQLMDRGRHFPHRRGVTIGEFLCETIRSNVNHLLEAAAKETRPLSIVSKREKDAAGTCSEEALSADENEAAEREALEKAERFYATLDSELEEYARLRVTDEYMTAKQCAAEMGITEPEVRLLHRRLLRHRDRWDNPGPRSCEELKRKHVPPVPGPGTRWRAHD